MRGEESPEGGRNLLSMTQHEVARTLVKSAPELWEVCSDPDSLGRHLEAFGEIRITRVEPETTVAWEGERASGTVRIEPSGWGTRVILTATPMAGPAPEVEPQQTETAVAVEAKPERVEPAAVAPEPVTVAPVAVAVAVAGEPEPPSDPVTQETSESSQTPARPGFFRRLGALMFRSLVTPVEYPEGAFGEAVPKDESQPPPVPVGDGNTNLAPEPAAVSEPEPETRSVPVMAAADPARAEPELDPGSVLAGVLDRLGSDHHRPFSRG